ncbi:hypothetical protein ST47_g4956 [Ascochyta rabiei]|uniref:Uncharacterized protein n=1 Tax=Didymella rabiei TaxID=5454 RepID=A0A163EU88_DIDRA|nr:hypothetical protein ST47_g4956 [Ascochyta rabiei]
MDGVFFPRPPGPFLTMAARDYHPYPLQNAHQLPLCTSRPTRRRRPAQRVDSGAEASAVDAETKTFAFAEDGEKIAELYDFVYRLRGYEADGGREDGSEDDSEEGDGCLGGRARDSIDMNIERSNTWESKGSRKGRNRKNKVKMALKWLGSCFRLGSGLKGYWVRL